MKDHIAYLETGDVCVEGVGGEKPDELCCLNNLLWIIQSTVMKTYGQKPSRNSSNVLKCEWCWYWLGGFYAAWLNGAAVARKGTRKDGEGANFSVHFLHTRKCFDQVVTVQSYWLFYFEVKVLCWGWLKMSIISLKTSFPVILRLYLNGVRQCSCRSLISAAQTVFVLFLKPWSEVTEPQFDWDWKQMYLHWNYGPWWWRVSDAIK